MKQGFELEALWEVPLGVLSYLFSRVVKWTLTFVSRYYNPASQRSQPEWQVVSAEFLKGPVKLLWTMSRARWNLHSLIAIAGPFNVSSSLSLDLTALNRSAKSWTAVVYTLQGYKTITSVSSLSIPTDRDWQSIELPPGRYLVGVRHYQWSDPIHLPAIQVDDQPALAAQPLTAPANFNQFYRNLVHRRGWLYTWLNFYVYPLLRYRRWLPSAFVKQTFLPVPNPETQFYYGALNTDEAVRLEVPPDLLNTHSLFLSLYTRDCFPLDWYPVTQTQHTTQAMTEKGAYILRVHPKDVLSLTRDSPEIHVSIT
ncbi:MAG: hypothetical protein ICV62_06365 [Cyanobacteria bacterium Co-bin13]|nr:hypothetical protein [Cyanobacteria bacterium Co-bin13]